MGSVFSTDPPAFEGPMGEFLSQSLIDERFWECWQVVGLHGVLGNDG